MQTLTIENEKLDIIQWITTLNNADDLKILRQLGELKAKYYNKSVSVSDEENQAILAGFADMQAGRVVPHSEIQATF